LNILTRDSSFNLFPSRLGAAAASQLGAVIVEQQQQREGEEEEDGSYRHTIGVKVVENFIQYEIFIH
jgi:hypothetical protein